MDGTHKNDMIVFSIATTKYMSRQNISNDYKYSTEFEWTVDSEAKVVEYLEIWKTGDRSDTPMRIIPNNAWKNLLNKIVGRLLIVKDDVVYHGDLRDMANMTALSPTDVSAFKTEMGMDWVKKSYQ